MGNRSIEYWPSADFATNTPITREAAVRGEVIFPLDQPLTVTPDWGHLRGFVDPDAVLALAGDAGRPKLLNYPGRQPVWPDKESAWLYEGCGKALTEFNRHLGLALSGFVEPIAVLTYSHGDEMTTHCDYTSWERVKLALVVSLTDPEEYIGGAIELTLPSERDGMPPTHLRAGDALIYPGWVPHRVHSVLQGTRKVMTAFAYGPAYR